MTLPNIRAFVHDAMDTPPSDGLFIVDTNVWINAVVHPSSPAFDEAPQNLKDKCKVYQNLLKQLPKRKRIVVSQFGEFLHAVEKIGLDRMRSEQNDRRIDVKTLRYSDTERTIVDRTSSLKYWSQILKFADVLGLTTATELSEEFYKTTTIDGYDALILQGMKTSGITNIVTDDGDWVGVNGIHVYTWNREVIGSGCKITRY